MGRQIRQRRLSGRGLSTRNAREEKERIQFLARMGWRGRSSSNDGGERSREGGAIIVPPGDSSVHNEEYKRVKQPNSQRLSDLSQGWMPSPTMPAPKIPRLPRLHIRPRSRPCSRSHVPAAPVSPVRPPLHVSRAPQPHGLVALPGSYRRPQGSSSYLRKQCHPLGLILCLRYHTPRRRLTPLSAPANSYLI